MPDTMKAYRCRHIHTTGSRCGSKSLREGNFCFYHNTTRKPAPKPEAPPINPAKEAFDLPFPEDRASIQLAIGEVLRRIANNTLDPRRAGLLLYGLQIASGNLPREKPAKLEPQDDPIETVESHPTLGQVAPIAEYTDDDDNHPLTPIGRLLRLFDHPEDLDPEIADQDDDRYPSPGTPPHPPVKNGSPDLSPLEDVLSA